MSRRVVDINENWQVVSVRPAFFEIIREPRTEGDALLVNNQPSLTGAERIPRNNKNLTMLQPELRETYMKSDKAVTDPSKSYQIIVDD